MHTSEVVCLLTAGTDPAAWQRALPQVLDIAFSQRQLRDTGQQPVGAPQQPNRSRGLHPRSVTV